MLAFFVRIKGLEPPRLAAPDPKSDVATNYTISARIIESGCKGKEFSLPLCCYGVDKKDF